MRLRFPLLVATALIAVSCGGGGGYSTSPGTNPGTGNPANPTPSTPVATNAVSVADNQFTPKDVQVNVGTTVTWTWVQGAVDHNVTFGDGVASANLKGGATYTRTFGTAGTFNYSCTLHSGMTGSVLVK